MSGSWVVPEGSKTFPAVLIIADSGPTDRNGNNPLAGENNSLKMLAEALAEKNIASLRYDKRGVGKSKGAGKDEAAMTFDLLLDDASAWVQWMRKQKAVQKVWIAGHSEGSLIGMLAAEKQKADGFVSIAGSGQRASQTLRVQLEKQPDMIKNGKLTYSNGFEHILQFAIEDWWIGDMYSHITQLPGFLNIDALEDSDVLLLHRDDQIRLFEQVPKFERFFRILLEKSMVMHQLRLMENISMTAAQRYEVFAKRYPKIIARVP